MKRVKKPVFFVITCAIIAFALLVADGFYSQYGDVETPLIKGLRDIRLGIDIQGGVDVTFVPAGGVEGTQQQMDAAMAVIELRLAALGINDSETYTDYNQSKLIVRFPWQAGEENFNPADAVKELGETAALKFVKGQDYTGETVITGAQVVSAQGMQQRTETGDLQNVVSLELNESGRTAFGAATSELVGTGGVISIFMDDVNISTATVQAAITDGRAVISGNFTPESAKALADKINSGALPFSLETESLKTIAPEMGRGALDAMVLGGLIAFGLIAVYMIVLYRLQGVVSVIALIGQVAGTLAFVSGFYAFMPSNTLTVPGIAGLILAVGIGVDANIIISERVKEEVNSGKKIESALSIGYKRAFTAILDGNLTLILVAFVLMGAFGVPSSLLAIILKPIFFMFGVSPEATIYSFGFTLVTGVALNFFFGVLMTMLMNAAVSKFKIFQNRKLYGETDKKEKKQFEFVGNTKKFSIFAAACILLTVAGAFFGVEMAIEFKGGTVLTYSYEGDADFSGVNADIEAIVGSAVNVRQGENLQSGTNAVTLEFGSNEGLSLDRQTEITDKLVEKYPDSNIEVLDTNDVSAKTGRSFLLKCLVAVVASIVFLVIYMAFRFKKIGGFSAGMFAIIALVHDCVFVFAAFLIFRYPINANFVAAALTILGYSINNTIVIYDRIRENSALMPKADFIENVNLSINQSLKRSVRTTVTTAITMLTVSIIALLSNVETILSFSIPLLFGLIAGTFSSLCLAPTLWAVSRSKKRTDK